MHSTNLKSLSPKNTEIARSFWVSMEILTFGISATLLRERMVAMDSRLKCTSRGSSLRGAIFPKILVPPFVCTVRRSSALQLRTSPTISKLLLTLEVEQVSNRIHELGIISLFWPDCASPIPTCIMLVPVRPPLPLPAPFPLPPPPRRRSAGI